MMRTRAARGCSKYRIAALRGKCEMDIATSVDVAMLVDRFYGEVRVGALVRPIFNDVAQVDWPTHMATLYSPDAARHRHVSRRALPRACRAPAGNALP